MTRRVNQPPANKSPQAIALREAASRFGKNPPVIDSQDSLGAKANRELLAAAMAYTYVAEREESDAAETDRIRRIKITKAEFAILAKFPQKFGVKHRVDLDKIASRVEIDRLIDLGLLEHRGRGRNTGVFISLDGIAKLEQR